MRVKVNGTTLFFDVEGAKLVTDGSSMREKPTLVLLHGGPGFDHSNFKPEYSELADVVQLVFLDHRGNGRSDRENPGSWTLDQWAEDVKDFCDVLEIEKPIVLGWSFGGFVAQAYAARFPTHPSKVILQSTAARLDVDRIASAFEDIGGPDAGAAARDFWTRHDDESMARFVTQCLPLYHSGPLDAQLLRCILNVELLSGFEGEMAMDLRADLSKVGVPVLVLAGTRDPITPVSAAEEIVSALPGPDVTFETFEGAGHFIQLSEPERFFSVVRSFIVS